MEQMMERESIELAKRVSDSVTKILAALIDALIERAGAKEENVLKAFEKYVKQGGELKANEIREEMIEEIEKAAKAEGLLCFVVNKTNTSAKPMMVTRSVDKDLLQRVVDRLESNGITLPGNHRMELEEIIDKSKEPRSAVKQDCSALRTEGNRSMV